jgi:hypothetical protein
VKSATGEFSAVEAYTGCADDVGTNAKKFKSITRESAILQKNIADRTATLEILGHGAANIWGQWMAEFMRGGETLDTEGPLCRYKNAWDRVRKIRAE